MSVRVVRVVALSVALLGGCGLLEQPAEDMPGTILLRCQAAADCSNGFVCDLETGSCVVGACSAEECDAGGTACCEPWERCSFENECIGDPAQPIGDECERSDDCPAGTFCSGGSCLNADGRCLCVGREDCSTSERCDREAYLCVPDIGGCQFCPSFVVLCCDEGELCDEESGFCYIEPDGQCPEAGSEDGCPLGERCDRLGRCINCLNDDSCGTGTYCDFTVGHCLPTPNAGTCIE